MERHIEEVVETLRKAKEREKKCSLLIGAGCSVTAGIPAAGRFVDEIQKQYPLAYKRAREKTYPRCMAEISVSERRDLISGFVDNAKINWAHLGIAQLMKHGYIDRVLTTNFDPLVIRACALCGIHPAVYDCAASTLFNPADIHDQAVFYLHGQRTGFVLLNTEEEVKSLSENLQPVFEDAGRGRVWLVVGYSGENDPVFEHLAKVRRFDNSLFWVINKDSQPKQHVQERLLVKGKDAFCVRGHNADDFFVLLAQKLGAFPPAFVGAPYDHLLDQLNMVTPYVIPGETSSVDITANTRTLLARHKTEVGDQSQTAAFVAGKYAEATVKASQGTDAIRSVWAWSLVLEGNSLRDQAIQKKQSEADNYFALAYQKYEAALSVQPNMPQALHSWGVAIAEQALKKAGGEQETLFGFAYEKFNRAVQIKPDFHDALVGWGKALTDQAQSNPQRVEDLLKLACEKFTQALEVKPDDVASLNNLGTALFRLGQSTSSSNADSLYAMANEKFAGALQIKPDYSFALTNWGALLATQALGKNGPECDELFASAYEKFQAAILINSQDLDAQKNWAIALENHAEKKSSEEADALFNKAIEKYELILKSEPDNAKISDAIAGALLKQSLRKDQHEAKEYLKKAYTHAMRAETLSPGAGSYNLACITARMGQDKLCAEWLEISLQEKRLPKRCYIANDPDFANVRERPWFISFMEKID